MHESLSLCPSGLQIENLATLPSNTILDERALAGHLKVSTRTIRRMVGRYELPPPVRFGGRATWQVGRILAWYSEMAEIREKKAKAAAQRLRSLS